MLNLPKDFSEPDLLELRSLFKKHTTWWIEDNYPKFGSEKDIINVLSYLGVYKSREEWSSLKSRVGEIITAYSELGSIIKVSRELKISERQIVKIVRESIPDRQVKSVLTNPDYFEKIDSSLKAYFLGFIAADGYLHNRNATQKYLSIGLHKKDVVILEKLREEVGSNVKIYNTWNRKNGPPDYRCLTLYSYKLVSDLEKYGLCQGKSLVLGNILSNVPEEFKGDYITGFWDGDGSWVKCGTLKPGANDIKGTVAGTEAHLKGIAEYVGIKGSWFHAKHHREETISWSFSSKADLVKFFTKTYYKCPFSLARKFDRISSCRYIKEYLDEIS